MIQPNGVKCVPTKWSRIGFQCDSAKGLKCVINVFQTNGLKHLKLGLYVIQQMVSNVFFLTK